MHLMIDIETLSTQSNAVITSFGFVEFDQNTIGDIGGSILNWPRQMNQLHRHVCPDTLRFWLSHADIATWAVEDAANLDWTSLHGLIVRMHEAEKIWANSPSFDMVLLKSLYQQLYPDAPWPFYRKERDVRTLKEYLSLDEMDRIYEKFQSRAHDPISDCLMQIELVRLAWHKIGYPDEVNRGSQEPTVESLSTIAEETTAEEEVTHTG